MGTSVQEKEEYKYDKASTYKKHYKQNIDLIDKNKANTKGESNGRYTKEYSKYEYAKTHKNKNGQIYQKPTEKQLREVRKLLEE